MLVSCGCISPVPMMSEEINASQIYYDTLVKEDPLNATAWCIWGNYYHNAFGQYDVALQSYNQSLELEPGYGYAWFSKGVPLRDMGYHNESRVCFKRALRSDPSLSSVIGGM
jgi:tetratricopeptide (TPR) repeat protein